MQGTGFKLTVIKEEDLSAHYGVALSPNGVLFACVSRLGLDFRNRCDQMYERRWTYGVVRLHQFLSQVLPPF